MHALPCQEALYKGYLISGKFAMEALGIQAKGHKRR